MGLEVVVYITILSEIGNQVSTEYKKLAYFQKILIPTENKPSSSVKVMIDLSFKYLNYIFHEKKPTQICILQSFLF